MVKRMPNTKSTGATYGCSNMGGKGQCRTLTYPMRGGLKTYENVIKIKEDLDKITGRDDSVLTIVVSRAGTEMEEWSAKYQIKECDSEKEAQNMKDRIDEYAKKQGGQTTLDEGAI